MGDQLQNFLPDTNEPGDTRTFTNIPVNIPDMPGVHAQTARMPYSDNPLSVHVADAKQRLSDSSEVSALPKILAIVAAFNGNFSPAIQLMEQSRKTKLAQEFLPYSMEIQHSIKVGDIKGAQSKIAEASGALGPRSPEIAQRLDMMTKSLAEQEGNLIDAKNYADYLEHNINEVAAKKGTDPKDDLRTPGLNSLKKILSRPGTPMSKTLLPKIIESLNVKSQVAAGAMAQSVEGTSLVGTVPLQQYARLSDYPPWVIEKTAKSLKLHPSEFISLINSAQTNQPYTVSTEQGSININTPQNQDNIRKLMANLMGRQAKMTVGKGAMIDPTVTIKALQDLSGNVERFAAREFGEYTPPDDSPVNLGFGGQDVTIDRTSGTGIPGLTPEQNLAMAQQQGGIAGSAQITVQPGVGQVVLQQPSIDLVKSYEDMIEARLRKQLLTEQEYKTYVTDGFMQLSVDKNNYETPFSYPVRPLTNAEVKSASGKVRTIPKEDAQKALSLYEAYRGLQYTDTLYRHLQNPTTIPQRLGNWFDTTLARYTSIYNANVGMAEIDRALISRAVEAINNTDMRNDPAVGRVKEVLSGKLVDARVGRQAVAQLLDRVREKLAVYVGAENIPDVKETLKGTAIPGTTPSTPYPGLVPGTGKKVLP